MERVFKVVMIGGVGSGKTSLRNYLLYGNYTGKYTPTTNSDFVSTHITLSSQEMIAIQIWDTCESSSELLTTHSLLQDADGVMLVCDGANSASLQALERHLPAIDTISKSRRGGLPVMLVRTKSDMVGADGERLNAGCKASKEFCLQRLCVDDIRCVTTSAREGRDVALAFQTMSELCYEHWCSTAELTPEPPDEMLKARPSRHGDPIAYYPFDYDGSLGTKPRFPPRGSRAGRLKGRLCRFFCLA